MRLSRSAVTSASPARMAATWRVSRSGPYQSSSSQWATMSPRASRHASLRMAPILRAAPPVAT